ncbi:MULTISPECIES: MarR family transcriptional regulator [Stenotrophomonas]|jgi:DNA-binding MarR family transcriptional regulator|uniref:MarR family transcriptional regulator n=1 Tax=Stenotrophomonas acidaminiphila TaxID=128780 RepID=A0A0R0E6V7_9GAMM|nr:MULTISPECIES: MarR family transcriptional regulator [Stenotrophomonas]OZB51278.1 MAG: MarR family transcriptional regulator [Stenotrophomonas sp. 14-69-23]ALJ28829.1 MarR family transcriptional regulator [Stenotrophomonas acidaminiphila]KRG85902.1 MarR family transcriptional regulator [Stenotrophomonas acidaminiphila]MCA7022753.1 MarR family transcriptional regulator [Stenotrophomonas acidaminiphila]MCE4075946.1 MarR family transcriptional regulator [Stenotrophomonas acidaminiphila]
MICSTSNPPSFGLLLRQTRDGLARQLDASMAEENIGIGFTHFVGLKTLAHMAPCTANELAQALDQVPSAVTRLLDKLESLGCVRREAHAQDRRALQIVLTEQGRELCARLKKRGDAVMDYAMRDLSPDEREQLMSLLTRIRDSLTPP